MERRAIDPVGIVRAKDRYSQAVAVEVGAARLLFVTGQQAWAADGSLVGPGDITAQTEQVFDLLAAIVAEAGGGLGHIVKLTCFVADLRLWHLAAVVRNRRMGETLAASTVVQVTGMTDPGALIEIEAIALIPTA